MGFITNICFALAAALSCCAAGLNIYQAVRDTTDHYRLRQLLFVGSLVTSSVLLGLFLHVWGAGILGGTNLFLLIAWGLLLAYVVIEVSTNSSTYGAFILPIAFIALLIAWFPALTPGQISEETAAVMVYQEWPVLIVHVGAFIVASGFFVTSGVASILLLMRSRQLKQHKTVGKQQGPSLARLQKLASRTVAIGLPIFTVGLLLGLSHGLINGQLELTSGSGAFFSARIVFSCLLWSCYVVYCGLTFITNVSWRASAWISIVGATGTLIVAVLSATTSMLGA